MPSKTGKTLGTEKPNPLVAKEAELERVRLEELDVAVQKGEIGPWREAFAEFRIRNPSPFVTHAYFLTQASTIPLLAISCGYLGVNPFLGLAGGISFLIAGFYPVTTLVFGRPPRGRVRVALFLLNFPAIALWAALTHPQSVANWIMACATLQLVGLPLGVAGFVLHRHYHEEDWRSFGKVLLTSAIFALPVAAAPIVLLWPGIKGAVGTDPLNYCVLVATLVTAVSANMKRTLREDEEFSPSLGCFVVPYLLYAYCGSLGGLVLGVALRSYL